MPRKPRIKLLEDAAEWKGETVDEAGLYIPIPDEVVKHLGISEWGRDYVFVTIKKITHKGAR